LPAPRQAREQIFRPRCVDVDHDHSGDTNHDHDDDDSDEGDHDHSPGQKCCSAFRARSKDEYRAPGACTDSFSSLGETMRLLGMIRKLDGEEAHLSHCITHAAHLPLRHRHPSPFL